LSLFRIFIIEKLYFLIFVASAACSLNKEVIQWVGEAGFPKDADFDVAVNSSPLAYVDVKDLAFNRIARSLKLIGGTGTLSLLLSHPVLQDKNL